MNTKLKALSDSTPEAKGTKNFRTEAAATHTSGGFLLPEVISDPFPSPPEASPLLEIDVVTRHADQSALHDKIRRRKIEKTAREKLQKALFHSNNLDKLEISSKLQSIGWKGRGWKGFRDCGDDAGVMMCIGCGSYKHITKRCSLKWCPHCNWRIADARKRELERMLVGNFGLKHLVLTQRNFETPLKPAIRESRAALLKLRRQVIGKKIFGGCASMEITNEGRGWHLHWHLLVTSTWVDMEKVSVAWGKLVGQDYAIVKIKAVTDKSYVQEVCKYAAKGSDIAKWDAETIVEFIEAITGTRLFTTFGMFTGLRKGTKLAIHRESKTVCACGCLEKVFGQTLTHALERM
jgi:hypothetical protein